MKCNQNCLKNAGNPRDMRRFQVRFDLVNILLVFTDNTKHLMDLVILSTAFTGNIYIKHFLAIY